MFRWPWKSTSKTRTTSSADTIPKKPDAGLARAKSGRKRWRVFGKRCRLAERGQSPPTKIWKRWPRPTGTGSIQTTYSRELLRFGSELAPRLDRINKRVDEIGENAWPRQARQQEQTHE